MSQAIVFLRKLGNMIKVIIHTYSHAVSHFYGKEFYIWTGLGPIGNTEKLPDLSYVSLATFEDNF